MGRRGEKAPGSKNSQKRNRATQKVYINQEGEQLVFKKRFTEKYAPKLAPFFVSSATAGLSMPTFKKKSTSTENRNPLETLVNRKSTHGLEARLPGTQ